MGQPGKLGWLLGGLLVAAGPVATASLRGQGAPPPSKWSFVRIDAPPPLSAPVVREVTAALVGDDVPARVHAEAAVGQDTPWCLSASGAVHPGRAGPRVVDIEDRRNEERSLNGGAAVI